MSSTHTSIRTDIGTTTPDRISVRGRDLARDVIGKIDFVQMLCLVVLGRLPDEAEASMIDTLLVTAVDHGLTPSAISTRMTWLGAPESLQGAVAAGLLGAGERFLGTVQNTAELLLREAADLAPDAKEPILQEIARRVVTTARQDGRALPGLGHPIHLNGDPRVPALFDTARANGFFGRHCRLAVALAEASGKPGAGGSEKRKLPLNAAGALGAILADMGLDPLFGRGLALIGRCAGLVAHVLEEREHPTAARMWELVLRQDTRNVLP
ncbi:MULTISPECIES: citryl-CoA lyase [Cupriavidus]|uniref:citrate synthase (unknown stereospecificity) n=1 Tax=Cupriavidus pinatubonensis (strain JMP 134 / LMG 1197) TaxID=264198 RepID=Q472W8_CUPPJ|nr:MULTISPECIES: citryl-CoA lyase [Cupriavidus]QYY32768.1 citryl-CoA lyase [Cupriavidus pinatubonensis]